jgi:hypothetical protein
MWIRLRGGLGKGDIIGELRKQRVARQIRARKSPGVVGMPVIPATQ